MKSFVTLCCVLVTLAAGVCAQEGGGARRDAQALSLSGEPMPLEHGGKIETAYDGFARETVVSLKRMSVTCGKAKGTASIMKGVSESWLAEDAKETLEVAIPHEAFLKLARAAYVEFSVGKTAFALRDKNVAALRDMNNRVKLPRAPAGGAAAGGGN